MSAAADRDLLLSALAGVKSGADQFADCMVLAAQVTGCVALISSGLLVWLNAPLRR
ncbi:MAG: hypothetical protein ACK57O_14900 [Planctomyces sp.]